MIELSSSECRQLLYKAAVAKQVSPALAQLFSQAVTRFCVHSSGPDIVRDLMIDFHYEYNALVDLKLEKRDHCLIVHLRSSSLVHLGAAIVDEIEVYRARENLAFSIQYEGVENPTILAAYLNWAAERNALFINAGFGEESELCRSLPDYISAFSYDKAGPSHIELHLEPVPLNHTVAQATRVQMSEKTLTYLQKVAIDYCVPSSEQSRLFGAGAGLFDAD